MRAPGRFPQTALWPIYSALLQVYPPSSTLPWPWLSQTYFLYSQGRAALFTCESAHSTTASQLCRDMCCSTPGGAVIVSVVPLSPAQKKKCFKMLGDEGTPGEVH